MKYRPFNISEAHCVVNLKVLQRDTDKVFGTVTEVQVNGEHDFVFIIQPCKGKQTIMDNNVGSIRITAQVLLRDFLIEKFDGEIIPAGVEE